MYQPINDSQDFGIPNLNRKRTEVFDESREIKQKHNEAKKKRKHRFSRSICSNEGDNLMFKNIFSPSNQDSQSVVDDDGREMSVKEYQQLVIGSGLTPPPKLINKSSSNGGYSGNNDSLNSKIDFR